MIRMSILRNFSAICGHRQIGLLQNASLDEAQKQVLALIVSCGIRGKRVILPESIEAIGRGFIIARDVRRYNRAQETTLCTFIRDTSGLLCGRVTDYAVNEATLAIEAVEMIPGYLGSARKKRIWVYDYQRSENHAEELIVPACLGGELTLTKEGNEQKWFPSGSAGRRLLDEITPCGRRIIGKAPTLRLFKRRRASCVVRSFAG